MTNLLRYMPNCVKIDRMLLSNIQDSPQKQHFVKDIITFSHDNNIVVLAEGVETQEELKMLIQLGVDLIQGYYTARPAREIVSSISKVIKNEIIEYSENASHNRGRQIYKSGKESQISLARLSAEKYSIIEITGTEDEQHDVTISGVLDMETEIYLKVRSGYKGKIILDNVTLQGKSHGASIDIGKDCDVTIVAQGENRLLNGGIRVPESSRLTFEGDGQIFIRVDGANYFGIGNDINARHGELIFEQDGIVEIKGSGMKGVAIGSGFGGPVSIQRGKYILNIVGQDGVGIGSFSGNVKPELVNCDLQISMATSRAVGVGSIMGDARIHMECTGYIGEFNVEEAIGFGTFEGKKSEMSIAHANLMLNMRGHKLCGIGANGGDVSLHLEECSVTVAGEGTEAIAWGNQVGTGKVDIKSGKLDGRMKTGFSTNVGVLEGKVSLENAEYIYIKNGETVVMQEF